MSSCLNALSAVTWEDILKPMIGHKTTESAKTWITKVLVLVYGAAGVGFAFIAQSFGGTVLQVQLLFCQLIFQYVLQLAIYFVQVFYD